MLDELTTLLRAAPAGAGYAHLANLVLMENILQKQTVATRRESLLRLRQLYGLKRSLLIFRALADLWPEAELERPVLAVLCATARDSILRATAPLVLEQPVGSPVTPLMFEAAIAAAFPGRYNATTLASMSRNVSSSWSQSGHLTGRKIKTRAKAVSGPASTAYALLMGCLCGKQGAFLLQTQWVEMLDAGGSVDANAFAASQRGWIEYRRIGDVVDIGFSWLTRQEEDMQDA